METPKAVEATLEERARKFIRKQNGCPSKKCIGCDREAEVASAFARTLLEEAAQMAQDYSDEMWKLYKSAPISDPRRANPHVEGLSDGAESVAIKIRRLAGKE